MEVYILSCKQPKVQKPIKITARTKVVAIGIKSCEQHYHSGLYCTAFQVLSRKALNFRRGRKVFTFLSQSQSPTQFITRRIGWVGFADTQISILPGVSRKCNVRSKIWWFTKICNSHYVSHFAAFFIVVGAKTSVAESRMAFASYAKGKELLC